MKSSAPVIAGMKGKSEVTISERKVSNGTIRTTTSWKDGNYSCTEEIVHENGTGKVGVENLAGARNTLPK